jgi:predicted acetyltransferase
LLKKRVHEEGLFPEIRIAELEDDFFSYVAKQISHSEDKDLPEGFVPETVYWLVDDDEFIGRGVLRHELTENLLKKGGHIGYAIRPSKRKKGYGKEILKLLMEKARDRNLTKILLTCNEDNLGSKKIIEANGGIFQDRIFLEDGKSWKLRYWINLT